MPSGGFGTYDEKAMIESTLYGLPMYEVTVPSPAPWSQRNTEVRATRAPAQPYTTSAYTTTLSISYDPVHTTTDGIYYTIDALAQANPGRPIQPKTSVLLDALPGLKPHGALLLGGVSAVEPALDPLIARPVPTSTGGLEEPNFAAQAWFPAKMFTVNRLGEKDRLVIVPAQFLGDQDEGALRRFTELTFTVVYSDSVDFTPPIIWKVESTLVAAGSGDTSAIQVSADDASGIERVLITYSADGQSWHSADLTYNTLTQQWQTSLTGLTEEASYFVQVMDAAGNVTVSDNKGQYFNLGRREIYLPLIFKSW